MREARRGRRERGCGRGRSSWRGQCRRAQELQGLLGLFLVVTAAAEAAEEEHAPRMVRYVCMTQQSTQQWMEGNATEDPRVVETAGGWLRVPDGALAGRSHVLHVRAHHRTAALHDIRHMPLPPRAAEERRLVLVGDTHGLHEHVPMPTGDVLLLHGDVYFQSRGGPWLDIVEGAVALQTLAAFFGAQPHPYKVMIAGNHDHVLEAMGVDAVRQLLQPAGIHYLLNSTAAVAGVRIFGLPTSELLHTRNRAFQVEKNSRDAHAVRDAVWARGADVEVVLTHGAAPAQRALTQMHTPSTGHRVTGLARRPLLHVYGHIHGGYGVKFHPGWTEVNAAVLDNDNCHKHPTVVVDLPLKQRPAF